MLKIVIFIIFIHQILYWVWLWQVKEYRIDRFRAGWQWRFLLNQFDLRHWWRPKWTLRAILSLLTVGLVTPIFILWKKFLVWKATEKMKSFKGTVIGITGSYGKSSTKELLTNVLRIKYNVLCTPKNVNSEIGVAQTILKNLKGNEDFFVVEMGAYKIGEIRAICNMVHPKVGIITGLGDQHLDLFGSLENIRKAKYELIDSLPPTGKKFIAEENFKLDEAKNIKVFKDHVAFVYKNQNFSLNILGKSLVRNVLGVIKVAQYFGLALSEISQGLKGNFDNIYPKLLEDNIVDNSYNNSLESFLSAIEYLQVWKDFKKIIITSGFLELGKNAKTDWEKVLAATKNIDELCVNTKPKLPITAKTVILLQGRVSKKIKNYVQSL